jgi:hypothetical protein
MPVLVLKSRWREHEGTIPEEELVILNRNIIGEQLNPLGLFVAVTSETRPILKRIGISLPVKNDSQG